MDANIQHHLAHVLLLLTLSYPIFINNLIFNIERLKSNPVLFKFRLTPYHDPVVLSDGLKPKDLLFIPLNSVYSILCPDIIH